MAAVGLVDALVGRSCGGSAARGEAGSARVGGGTISGVLIMGDPSSIGWRDGAAFGKQPHEEEFAHERAATSV
jgi:hypothetical protein